MEVSIKFKIRKKDLKQVGLFFGEVLGCFISATLAEDLAGNSPQPEKAEEVKTIDKELLAAIAQAYDVMNEDDSETAFEETQIIRNIQILRKDENLFKDVSNVVLMFHMMSLGFERVCISRPDVPPIFGYYISPSKDLLIALEEDAKKKAT